MQPDTLNAIVYVVAGIPVAAIFLYGIYRIASDAMGYWSQTMTESKEVHNAPIAHEEGRHPRALKGAPTLACGRELEPGSGSACCSPYCS